MNVITICLTINEAKKKTFSSINCNWKNLKTNKKVVLKVLLRRNWRDFWAYTIWAFDGLDERVTITIHQHGILQIVYNFLFEREDCLSKPTSTTFSAKVINVRTSWQRKHLLLATSEYWIAIALFCICTPFLYFVPIIFGWLGHFIPRLYNL